MNSPFSQVDMRFYPQCALDRLAMAVNTVGLLNQVLRWGWSKSSSTLLRLAQSGKFRTGQEGFEPPTPWSVATCSSPLSYRPLLRTS
jgi:hypothetical protein